MSEKEIEELVNSRSKLYTSYSVKDKEGHYRRVVDVDSVVELIAELMPKRVTGTVLLAELLKDGVSRNENGQPVIRMVPDGARGTRGGSTAYVRHDAMVRLLNVMNGGTKQ